MQVLLPIEQGLHNLTSVSISPQTAVDFRQGKAVTVQQSDCTGITSVYINNSEFIGLGEINENGVLQPKRLLAQKNN
jgi:tRNA pseudouridine55 synthase